MGKDETPKDFIITNQSPYYLHPSDAPGAIITAIKFDGKNYDLWEKAVKTALKSKNKLGFIDGSIQRPMVEKEEFLAELNVLEMVNSMVISWILNVLDPKLHASIAYVDSAHITWENIHKQYLVPNAPRIHQLKAEIASSKQGNMDVVDFFSKLMGLWNELDNYVKYTKCTCKAAKQFMS